MSSESLASLSVPRPGPHVPLRAWIVLGVVLVADVMDLVDSTIANIAAPSIVKDLGGGELLVKWLGTAYTLAMGVCLVLGGRLGDKFGRRRLFLVGMAGFTLASLTCGLSQSPAMMIAARTLQGSFGALMIPQGFGMMRLVFPREQLGKAFSAFGPVLGASAMGGPILAGFLIDANVAGLGWRSVFLINIVFGVAGFVTALKWLPEAPGARETIVDGAGSGLLAGAMFGLLFGLTHGSSNGWTLTALAAIAVGTVSIGAFWWRQTTAPNPLLKPSLLENRGFTSGLVLGLFFFAAVNGLCYVLSLFMQGVLRRNPTGAALGLAPVCIGIVLASVVGAPLIARLGRTLIFVGLIVTLTGTVLLLALVIRSGANVGNLSMGVALLVMGFGMGTCFGTLFDVALGDTSPQEAGSATGALSAIQQLASGIGSAAVTSAYFSALPFGGGTRAISASLVVVCGALLLCSGLVWLLPRHAAVGSRHES